MRPCISLSRSFLLWITFGLGFKIKGDTANDISWTSDDVTWSDDDVILCTGFPEISLRFDSNVWISRINLERHSENCRRFTIRCNISCQWRNKPEIWKKLSVIIFQDVWGCGSFFWPLFKLLFSSRLPFRRNPINIQLATHICATLVMITHLELIFAQSGSFKLCYKNPELNLVGGGQYFCIHKLE